MKTQIFSEKQILEAAALLKKGEIVAFPTETVYGLGASLFDLCAIEKIYVAKGRPKVKPLTAHIATLSQVKEIAIDIPDAFYLLANAFFPGPLTIILKKHPHVPNCATAGSNTIGIRFPDHPIAQHLIQEVGSPLVAPSANLSGCLSPVTADEVLRDLNGKIAAVVDGGICPLGIPSTIVDLVSFEYPVILRIGQITSKDLEGVIGAQHHESSCSGSSRG